LGVASAAAATVAVFAFAYQFFQTSDDSPIDALADDWLAELDPKWNDGAQSPAGFALPAAITAEAAGWQRVGTIGGVQGVAYKLAHATAGSATLFVMRLTRHDAPSFPPADPQSTTGGRSIGYWHAGNLLYVLVVDGNQHKYRAFVNSARAPLA
jgi:hypothetical protein